MRKLVIGDVDVMRMAIQQEITHSDESRYDHRLHGLPLVTGGHSCQQAAELFGEDRRTVQRWVTRFETHELIGLRDVAPVAECGCRPTRYCGDYAASSKTEYLICSESSNTMASSASMTR